MDAPLGLKKPPAISFMDDIPSSTHSAHGHRPSSTVVSRYAKAHCWMWRSPPPVLSAGFKILLLPVKSILPKGWFMPTPVSSTSKAALECPAR